MTKKTFLTILILSMVTILSLASVAHPSMYTISQITNDSGNNYSPQINNSGQVVWIKGAGTTRGIFLYDGSSTIQLTSVYNDYYRNLQINDAGQVVWEGDYQIFLYDGPNRTKLSDNSYYNVNPQINNDGHVVWNGYNTSDSKIFLYDGTHVSQLTGNYGYNQNPQINNNGYVVWEGFEDNSHDIFLYDGTNTIQLSDSSYQSVHPQINDAGQVVWEGGKPGFPNGQIFLFGEKRRIQISDSSYQNQNPQINNNGDVVWEGYDGSDHEIFLYNGITTIQLTNNSYGEANPQISDNGYVVWQKRNDLYNSIFFYDGVDVTPITDESYNFVNEIYPQINNRGDIVWNGWFEGSPSQIFIARRTVMLTLLSPIGSETIPSGSIYTIKWAVSPQMVKFDLYYSLNGGTTWQPIAKKVPGTSYDWIVPVPTNNKKKCLVKVIGYDASDIKMGEDTSHKTFKIEVVKVISPNGGETLKSGNTWTITWQTNGTKRPAAYAQIFYTLDGGTTWVFKNLLQGNPGSYTWTVPLVTKTKCKVKVVLKDAKLITVGSDTSDSNFTIQP